MSSSLKLAMVVVILMASQDLAAATRSRCSDYVMSLKGNSENADFDSEACSSRIGNSNSQHEQSAHTIVNEHISQSFLYSIMAGHFATDAVNRLGFSKYMNDLADSMWTDSVKMVKYIGVLGGGMAPLDDPAKQATTGLRVTNAKVGPWTEMEALATILDRHSILAKQVHDLHGKSENSALVGFLEKEFTDKHANKMREISGLLTSLGPILQESGNKELILHLFDQKLLG